MQKILAFLLMFFIFSTGLLYSFQNLVINGVTYQFPDVDDEEWGQNVTDWATAVTNGMFQKAGGTFTLTAEAYFGENFGIRSLYFKEKDLPTASTGAR